MTRYLLDTNVLIRHWRRESPATQLVTELAARGDDLWVCSVNIAEFYAGARLGERPEFDDFLSTLECTAVTRADGVQAGQWRHDYARRGMQITLGDALVAAVVQRVGATLVTENVKDFPMPGLDLLDPRSR